MVLFFDQNVDSTKYRHLERGVGRGLNYRILTKMSKWSMGRVAEITILCATDILVKFYSHAFFASNWTVGVPGGEFSQYFCFLPSIFFFFHFSKNKYQIIAKEYASDASLFVVLFPFCNISFFLPNMSLIFLNFYCCFEHGRGFWQPNPQKSWPYWSQAEC